MGLIASDLELQAEQVGAWVFKTLNELRANGWSVAVHNDYRLNGQQMTFWLMTHECGLYLKGEGSSDADAIGQIEKQARKVFAPEP